jgi:hypothetical protein
MTLTVEKPQLLCAEQVGIISAVKRSNTRTYIVTKNIMKGIKIEEIKK